MTYNVFGGTLNFAQSNAWYCYACMSSSSQVLRELSHVYTLIGQTGCEIVTSFLLCYFVVGH